MTEPTIKRYAPSLSVGVCIDPGFMFAVSGKLIRRNILPLNRGLTFFLNDEKNVCFAANCVRHSSLPNLAVCRFCLEEAAADGRRQVKNRRMSSESHVWPVGQGKDLYVHFRTRSGKNWHASSRELMAACSKPGRSIHPIGSTKHRGYSWTAAQQSLPYSQEGTGNTGATPPTSILQVRFPEFTPPPPSPLPLLRHPHS